MTPEISGTAQQWGLSVLKLTCFTGLGCTPNGVKFLVGRKVPLFVRKGKMPAISGFG